MNNRFTEAEDDIIRNCWKVMTSVQIQKLIPHRSSQSICGRANRLGLDAGDRHGCTKKGGDSSRIWTVAEEKKLKGLIANGHTRREASNKLGRSVDSIKWKMATLGLKLTKTALKRRCRLTRPESIARILSKHMQCNCDLDNWVPTKLTGHSDVCVIHKEVIHRLAIDKQSGEIPLSHLLVLYNLRPFNFTSRGPFGIRIHGFSESNEMVRASMTFEGNEIRIHANYTKAHHFNLSDPDLIPKIKALLNDPIFYNASSETPFIITS